jgi:hypothetical protein
MSLFRPPGVRKFSMSWDLWWVTIAGEAGGKQNLAEKIDSNFQVFRAEYQNLPASHRHLKNPSLKQPQF